MEPNVMSKLAGLRTQRAAHVDQMVALTNADGTFDAKAFTELEEKVRGLDVQIAASERAQGLQASLARPHGEQLDIVADVVDGWKAGAPRSLKHLRSSEGQL